MRIRFSIITPVYNAEKYLPKAVESVLTQTCPNFEMICTDDGSRDASGEILDQYAVKDDRIKVIHQANAGEGTARNVALSKARGEWIVFLDADDLLPPWALENYAQCAEKCPKAELMRFGLHEFREDNDPIWERLKCPDTAIDVEDISDVIPYSASVAHFFQYAYRRSLCEGLRYTDHMVGADRMFLMRCLFRASRIAVATPYSYGYRRIPTSITGSRMTLRKYRDSLRYKIDIFALAKEEKKRMSRGSIRELANLLTEYAVRAIGRLDRQDQPEGWRLWRESLSSLACVRGLTPWRRFTVCVCRMFPFACVAWFLCAFPWWLKKKGFHR